MMKPSNPDNPPDPKATLFCQACGHTSPPDGDWSITERDDGRTDIDCPDCNRTLLSQPRFRLLA